MTDEPNGPDSRFVLANERTYLAYVRTALALLAAGAALLHLDDFLNGDAPTRIVGAALMLGGVAAAAGGYLRWRSNDIRLRSGQPLAQTRIPLLLVCVVVALGLVTTVLAVI